MKEELNNIDKLFVNAWEESGGTPPAEGWDKLEKKLLITELKSFKFANVQRKYWYISTAATVIAVILLYNLIQNQPNTQQPIARTTIDNSVQTPKEMLNSNSRKPNQQEPVITKIDSTTRAEETSKTVSASQSTVYKVIEHQNNAVTDMERKERATARPDLLINPLKSRILQNNLINSKESCIVRTNLHQQNNYRTENHSFSEQIPLEPVSYYTLGINLGSTWMIENKQQQEKINQPELFVGINLRYNTPILFLETALDLSYFRSVYQTNYLYDTLLGKMIAPGYDIIEVINSQGDTVLERQFHTEIISIYDTLSSKDEVVISSHSTVLSIPIHLGTVVYRHGNFYTSVFTGVMTKVYLIKNQSLPQYGSDYREIIDFETSPTNSLTPEFYIQGGVMFGYQVVDHANLEIKSTYNQLLGDNKSTLQKSKSNIQFSLGINYRF